MDDRSLLDRFLTARDDRAFRELVERHLDFVHSVARRVTANEELARDTAQAVFAKLARDGAGMPRELSLAAWLHRTTRCAAVDLVRTEDRRRKREQLAHHDRALMDPTPEPEWERLAPVIDEVIDALPAADRELVLSKYYRNETFAGIAARLGWTEANARKRASRALEKLRTLLSRRGVTTTATALAVVLPAHAVTPAPASLAASVLTAASSSPSLTAPLVMTTAQKSTTAAAAAVLLLASGWTGHAIGTSQVRATVAPQPSRASSVQDRTGGMAGQHRVAETAALSFERLLSGESRDTWAVVSRLNAADVPKWLEKLHAHRASVAAHSAEGDRLAEIESALYFHWATADPQAAWAAASALPVPPHHDVRQRVESLVKSVLSAWMRRDPDAAYRAAKDHPQHGYVARDMLVLTWTAATLEENLAKYPDKRRDLLGWFSGSVVRDAAHREEVLAYLFREPAPKDADWGRMLLFRAWGYDDFDAAVAKAEELKQPQMMGLIYKDNVRMNPHKAMPWAISQGVPPGGPDWEQGYGHWLGTDREGARTWFAGQAEKWEADGHHGAVAGFLSAEMNHALLGAKLGHPDAELEESTARQLGDFLTRWRQQDPDAESKWFTAATKGTRDHLIETGNHP